MTIAVLERKKTTPVLDRIIPAVKGEFYSYEADFSLGSPLYFFLKCKSNKSWPMTTEREVLLSELDLVFLFGDSVQICAPNSTKAGEFLGDRLGKIEPAELNTTELRKADVAASSFEQCFAEKNPGRLVQIFETAESSAATMVIAEGSILSVRTGSNKYGLLLIERLTETDCGLRACHVLL